jgi:hypothetical protein
MRDYKDWLVIRENNLNEFIGQMIDTGRRWAGYDSPIRAKRRPQDTDRLHRELSPIVNKFLTAIGITSAAENNYLLSKVNTTPPTGRRRAERIWQYIHEDDIPGRIIQAIQGFAANKTYGDRYGRGELSHQDALIILRWMDTIQIASESEYNYKRKRATNPDYAPQPSRTTLRQEYFRGLEDFSHWWDNKVGSTAQKQGRRGSQWWSAEREYQQQQQRTPQSNQANLLKQTLDTVREFLARNFNRKELERRIAAIENSLGGSSSP